RCWTSVKASIFQRKTKLLAGWRTSVQHCGGDRKLLTLPQLFGCAEPVPVFPILPELPFTCHSADGDFNSNDGREHLVDKLIRGIGHLPGFGRSGAPLVNGSKSRDNAANEVFIFANLDFSMDVNNLVIPCGDLAVKFL